MSFVKFGRLGESTIPLSPHFRVLQKFGSTVNNRTSDLQCNRYILKRRVVGLTCR